MTRYHTTAEGNIPFTPEEEAERDAEEMAWANKPEPVKEPTTSEIVEVLVSKGVISPDDLKGK
jgi:hypothetical protein